MSSRISIPEPCPASWADMMPAPGGRHCAACNHIVVDFTTLNEADTLAALRQPGRVCGRFRPEQVRPTFGWAPWLAAALAALAGCEPNPTTTLTPPVAETAVHHDSILVRGKVVDKEDGRPLAQAIIISELDTTLYTRTHADGTFALMLPQALRGTQLVAAQPAPEHLTPHAPEPGLYIPRYFPAEGGSSVVIQLRNPGPMLGQPILEPQENYSPAVMPHVVHLAPPPPPPHLSQYKLPL